MGPVSFFVPSLNVTSALSTRSSFDGLPYSLTEATVDSSANVTVNDLSASPFSGVQTPSYGAAHPIRSVLSSSLKSFRRSECPELAVITAFAQSESVLLCQKTLSPLITEIACIFAF